MRPVWSGGIVKHREKNTERCPICGGSGAHSYDCQLEIHQQTRCCDLGKDALCQCGKSSLGLHTVGYCEAIKLSDVG